jgi:TonB family protein
MLAIVELLKGRVAMCSSPSVVWTAMKCAFKVAVVIGVVMSGSAAWSQQTPPGMIIASSNDPASPKVDKQPELVSSVDPEYSDEARKLKLSGRVVVSLTVDEKGRPRNVRAVQGPGHGLDEKAVKAVKQYRFKPALKDGKPVPAQIMFDVSFQTYSGNESPPVIWALTPPSGQAAPELPPGPAFATRTALINRPPELIHPVVPEYSDEARARKMNATVIVGLTVDEKGYPQDVHIIHRAGHGLDEEAVKCVQQYRFNPALKDSQPVATSIRVEVHFKIH